MPSSRPPISLHEGWNQFIKPNAIDVLVDMLNNDFTKRKKFTRAECFDTYKTCYDMCVQRDPHNHSGELYRLHGETIHTYLEGTVQPAILAKDDEGFVPELLHRWHNHQIMNKWMRMFFMYLDRYYVNRENLPQLADAGINKFRTIILEQVKDRAVEVLLRRIDAERDRMAAPSVSIERCISLFHQMGKNDGGPSFLAEMEEHLVESTRSYYRAKALAWLASEPPPTYLQNVESALLAEGARLTHYLGLGACLRLMAVTQEELVERPGEGLLARYEAHARWSLAFERPEDLRRIHRLFRSSPSLLGSVASLLRRSMESWGARVVDTAMARAEAIRPAPTHDTLVDTLLDLHGDFVGVAQNHLGKDKVLRRAIDEAFSSVVSRNVPGQWNAAELLCTYCDRLLGGQGCCFPDEAVEQGLSKALRLFDSLTAKDLFAEIHRSLLARRLLRQDARSRDAERAVLAHLRAVSGAELTEKMEDMLADMEAADRNSGDASAALASQGPAAAGTWTTRVLTMSSWPNHVALSFALPPDLATYFRNFEAQYRQHTGSRRLQWQHTLGRGIVRGQYHDRAFPVIFDFEVSSLQAAVLCLFNHHDKLSAREISAALQLDDDFLAHTLHSLSCGEHQIMLKTHATLPVDSADVFRYNPHFAAPSVQVQLVYVAPDAVDPFQRVEHVRAVAIDAAILKVMRRRSCLVYKELVELVRAQLRLFRPEGDDLKNRISSLIERGLLHRDLDAGGVFHFKSYAL